MSHSPTCYPLSLYHLTLPPTPPSHPTFPPLHPALTPSPQVARRGGVSLAQLIRDFQEKYNQFVIFYQTGKLAYHSSKIWEQWDGQFSITQRTGGWVDMGRGAGLGIVCRYPYVALRWWLVHCLFVFSLTILTSPTPRTRPTHHCLYSPFLQSHPIPSFHPSSPFQTN